MFAPTGTGPGSRHPRRPPPAPPIRRGDAAEAAPERSRQVPNRSSSPALTATRWSMWAAAPSRPSSHGHDRHLRAAGRRPPRRGVDHVADRAGARHDQLPAERLDVPALGDEQFAGPARDRPSRVDVAGEREPVAEPAGPPERGLAEPAEPDRDRPARSRVDAAALDAVELAVERHERARPTAAGAAGPARSSRRPRLAKSWPSASYSTQFHPVPTPSRSRPCESRSTSAACWATSTVWRCGRINTPVASSIRLVIAASVAHRHERVVERVVAACTDPTTAARGRRARRPRRGRRRATCRSPAARPPRLIVGQRVRILRQLGLREHDAELHRLGPPRVRDPALAARFDARLRAPGAPAIRHSAVDLDPAIVVLAPQHHVGAPARRRTGATPARSSPASAVVAPGERRWRCCRSGAGSPRTAPAPGSSSRPPRRRRARHRCVATRTRSRR